MKKFSIFVVHKICINRKEFQFSENFAESESESTIVFCHDFSKHL